MTALLVVLCALGWTFFFIMWKAYTETNKDNEDLWSDYNSMYDAFLDALDDSDNKIAKLRWRIKQRGENPFDVQEAGMSALYMNKAAEIRKSNDDFKRVRHALSIAASQHSRQRAEKLGVGVP